MWLGCCALAAQRTAAAGVRAGSYSPITCTCKHTDAAPASTHVQEGRVVVPPKPQVLLGHLAKDLLGAQVWGHGHIHVDLGQRLVPLVDQAAAMHKLVPGTGRQPRSHALLPCGVCAVPVRPPGALVVGRGRLCQLCVAMRAAAARCGR
jgi:hypothetical protein